jgi:hypothetical protein
LSRPDTILRFYRKDLEIAKAQALQSLETLSGERPMREFLTEEEIVSNWNW